MQFGEKSISDILSGKKTTTRRLVKEGETFENFEVNPRNDSDDVLGVANKNGKKKWYEGQILSVQSGRGKPVIWYCPKCKWNITPKLKTPNHFGWGVKHWCTPTDCMVGLDSKVNPLRIKIIDIRQEQLSEITLIDSKKEGFENRFDFLVAFKKINPKSTMENLVWVLEFCVVE